ncbi:hypothetical protein [Algibacter lectus]|uniref:hypothetical protein n=1 Tax=Algibacter lectus TaxID=221126 RepID=UPI001D10D7A2|nr:hypothetical protein [Algibacter lectus]
MYPVSLSDISVISIGLSAEIIVFLSSSAKEASNRLANCFLILSAPPQPGLLTPSSSPFSSNFLLGH